MKTYNHTQEGVGLGTAFPTYVPHFDSFLPLQAREDRAAERLYSIWGAQWYKEESRVWEDGKSSFPGNLYLSAVYNLSNGVRKYITFCLPAPNYIM